MSELKLGELTDVAADVVHDGPVLRSKHAQAGKAMAIATFAMAGASGVQALLYLRSFGVNSRTDGFFAALALYTIVGLFGQSIRVTSAPLLVTPRPRIAPVQFAAALGLIALPVIIATGPLASLLAQLLAPGLVAAGRATTRDALPILGAAMVLQLWASGAATLLAVRDRFHAIAVAYCSAGAAGVVGYVVLEPVAGELTLAWSMLIVAVVTFGTMIIAVSRSRPTATRRPHGALRPQALLRVTGSILGRTGIYLAFNGLYLVTLAFAGRYRAGDATVVSYAYLFASYLVAGTGFSLGTARIADMARGVRSTWRDVLETVPQGFRYVMLLSAPALAGLIAFGAPLIGAVLPASFSSEQVASLQKFALLMVPWTVAAQLVNLLLPVMFATGRERVLNVCAPILIVAQVAVTAAGGSLFGIYGVVGAMCVTPLAFAGYMLVSESGDDLPRVTWELTRDGVRFLLLAAGSFGTASVVALAAPGGITSAMVCGVVGSFAYIAGVRATAGHQLKRLLHHAPAHEAGPTVSNARGVPT